MYRLLEIVLALSPFAAYAFWRVSAEEGGPSLPVLIASGLGLVLLIGSLVWFAGEDRLPPGDVYVPPHIENGRVVPAQTQQR